MADTGISAQEQLMIELMNAARLNPGAMAAKFGISLNEGLAAGTIANKAYEPLAWNIDLNEAAAKHSGWLIENDSDSLTGPGGSTFATRAVAEGYAKMVPLTYYQNFWALGSAKVDPTESMLGFFQEQFAGFASSRMRPVIFGNYSEFGTGQEIGEWTDPALDWTMDTAQYSQYIGDSGKTAITGVAYLDRDGDRFYDVGEGLGGVVFDRLSDGKGAATSMSAGGYNVAVPNSLAGWTTVEVKHGASTMRVEVEVNRANVKLDYLGNGTLASSADMTLGTGAKNGILLGMANLELRGNAGANSLDGNAGLNKVWGGGGNDAIHGMNGNDSLWGGDGNDSIWGDSGNDKLYGDKGADTLWGGAGNDTLDGGVGADVFIFADSAASTIGKDTVRYESDDKIRIDLAGALPNEAKWENSHITKVADGFNIAIGDGGTIHVITTASLNALEADLVLI